MGSELSGEVIQGEKAAAGIEAFLILAVAALHFAVVARRVGSDEFVADTQVGIPLEQLFQEIGGGTGGLLRVGGQEAQACKLINGSILEQAQLRVSDAAAGDHLHIYLNPLAGIGHLLVGLWLAGRFLLFGWEQPQLSHDPEQALRAAGIATLPQPVPQFHHAEAGVPAAHVPDQLQLCLCMLVRVSVGPPGLAGQGFHGSIPARLPEVDIRTALVVPPAGLLDAVPLRILHQGLPVCHVLCYTLAHEGYGPLSYSWCVVTQL